MPNYCVIKHCRDRNASFHALPNPNLRKVWINYIEILNGEKLEISKITRLYSRPTHFKCDVFHNYEQKVMGFAKTACLKPDAVPTINEDQDKVCLHNLTVCYLLAVWLSIILLM